MRPETIQRRSRTKAERTQALRKAARERAREVVSPRTLTHLSLAELNLEWNYIWDDLQAYRNRPRGVAKSWQWRETIAWLERRLKAVETLIKFAERAG